MEPNVFVVSKAEAVSEEALISMARNAIYQEAWVVGECASVWTQKYARGRTDADFAEIIGLSREQVNQRRNVYEKFHSHGCRDRLTWSHYLVALSWDDSHEVLDWAADAEATVAEMRAWRRAQRGEDLTTTPDAKPPGDSADTSASKEPPATKEKASKDAKSEEKPTTSESMDMVSRDSGVETYVPFRQETGSAKKERKKKADKPAANVVPESDDADRFTEAVDNAMKKFTTEKQQRVVKRLLSRVSTRLESLESLLPDVSGADDCVDLIHGLAAYSCRILKAVNWTSEDRAMCQKISEAFASMALAAGELASGDTQQKALFDAGPVEGLKVPLSTVLRVWNEAFDTNSIPTDKRRAALRARLKEPFFVANWQTAIDRARSSPFCCGHNDRKWVANIDWFLKPDTVVKLMEGNHDGIEATTYSAAETREQQNADAIATALESGLYSREQLRREHLGFNGQ